MGGWAASIAVPRRRRGGYYRRLIRAPDLDDEEMPAPMTMTVGAEQGGLFTISGRQWLILLMVQLANMLFGMTITLANLVLPQMRGNLSATQEEISWVITLNLAATAVATPMTGWLASRLGWR